MSKPTPMDANGSIIHVPGGGFDVRNCPDAEELASLIVRACNAHDELLKLVAVAKRAAEMPGRDWLEGQDALCRALVELQQATGLVEVQA